MESVRQELNLRREWPMEDTQMRCISYNANCTSILSLLQTAVQELPGVL